MEAQGWALPYVHEMVMPAVRRQVERYKEVVMKDLRAGKLAVQVGAAGWAPWHVADWPKC